MMNNLLKFFQRMQKVNYHIVPSKKFSDKQIELSQYYKFLTAAHKEQAEVIDKLYQLVDIIELDKSKRKLKPKSERTCRFCGKSFPDVKFQNKAHLIPEQLENKTLLSDFECDTCNSKFGKFENELANFLGPFRSLTKMAGKTGINNFKSRNGDIYIDAKSKDLVDVKAQKITKRKNKKEGEIHTIQTIGYPYRPINIYKCFLKMAFSLIDEREINLFKGSIDFLQDDTYKKEPRFDTLFAIHQFFIPGKIIESSRVYVYKLIEEQFKLRYPTYTFVFYFKNLILQLYIPFYQLDLAKYSRIKGLLVFPPLITEKWQLKFGPAQPIVHRLNDEKLIKEPIHYTEIKITNPKRSSIMFSQKK